MEHGAGQPLLVSSSDLWILAVPTLTEALNSSRHAVATCVQTPTLISSAYVWLSVQGSELVPQLIMGPGHCAMQSCMTQLYW